MQIKTSFESATTLVRHITAVVGDGWEVRISPRGRNIRFKSPDGACVSLKLSRTFSMEWAVAGALFQMAMVRPKKRGKLKGKHGLRLGLFQEKKKESNKNG